MILIASRGYVGETGCGFVEYTNAPKVRFATGCDPGDGLNRLLQHLGSAIWMLFFQVSDCSPHISFFLLTAPSFPSSY